MSNILKFKKNEIVIRSWTDFQEVAFSESWNPQIERYRSKYTFRGLSHSSYNLKSTLSRLGGDYPVLEKHILRNFVKYAHKNLVESNSVWNWLALAQHHGLPTRMLDWTYSPLIAAHFATSCMEYNTDSAVWAVNYYGLKNMLPKKLRAELDREGANIFTVEMLSNVITSIDEFESLTKNNFPIFLEPPSIDERITNQFAMFSMMSNPEIHFDTWLLKYPELFKKIIIPLDVKPEIRDKLDQSNITERVLFPGLDGLSKWLTRMYTPTLSTNKKKKTG